MISAAGAITTANENMLLSSENNQKSVGRSATNDMTSKCETGSKPEGSGLILDNKYMLNRDCKFWTVFGPGPTFGPTFLVFCEGDNKYN